MSEGRSRERIDEIGRALGAHGCRMLDVHSDADHNRSVFTCVGGPQQLADALVAATRVAVRDIDMRTHDGAHPCIGAVDVVPIVFLRGQDRATARGEALAVANRIAGELDLPVFLYGELASSPERRERAFFRSGGVGMLADRLASGEVAPDFGPSRLHPTAGGTLVAARPPLVAFNVELETGDVEVARAIAAEVREADGGLSGVRAIGVKLASEGVAQVSTNVHDPFRVPLREVVDRIAHAAQRRGTSLRAAEIVGLTPAAALDGFPGDVPLKGFDEHRHVLEKRLAASSSHG